MAEITGTAAGEYLYGTDDNEVIRAGDGRDTVFGEGGDDLLEGEGGDDRLTGGPGFDTVNGGMGNDSLYDGAGDDLLIGGSGDDIFTGDLVEGGTDTLLGGEGDDTFRLIGFDADDVVDAGAGNDQVEVILTLTREARVEVSLGAGRDVLALEAKANDDVRVATHEAVVSDFDVCADRLDLTLSLDELIGWDGDINPFSADAGFFRLRQDGTDVLFEVDHDGAAGADGENDPFATFLRFEGLRVLDLGAENFLDGLVPLVVLDDAVVFSGGAANDIVDGSNDADTLDGGAGHDVLQGFEGADMIIGGDGNDLLIGDMPGVSSCAGSEADGVS